MTTIDRFVVSPLAQTIGWTIVHTLWQGAVAAALLGFALFAVRSARLRYLAACSALLLMVGGFAVTLIHFLPTATLTSEALKAPNLIWNSAFEGSKGSPWYADLGLAVPWITPIWLCGMLAIYMRTLVSCWSVRRLRRRGVCAPPGRWLRELARLQRLLRVSRPVQLLESSLAEVPLVLGHFRPLILIPAGLLVGLPACQIEAILLHELAHIRRHDYLLNVVQQLAEGLLFYHPAAWWISSVISAERESCCDYMVISVTGNAPEYVRTLTALEQNRFGGHQPAIAITGGPLMKRINRLLYPEVRNTSWTVLLAAAALLTVGAASLVAWQADKAARDPRASEAKTNANYATSIPTNGSGPGESYQKWLNEEVIYIIDDAERAAFEGLSSNEERDKFIEQFWERRNPRPGSSANAFKEEHYRRISFANKRFATVSGTPGWRTDRGHIYIVYGPPDEIDSHPKNEPKPAIETWLYRHVEGIGDNATITFVDRTGRGDYHLSPASPH